MVHSGGLYISERRRAPKRRRAQGSLPLPHPFDGPASSRFRTAESGRCQLRSSTTNATVVMRTWTQFREVRLLRLRSKDLEPDFSTQS